MVCPDDVAQPTQQDRTLCSGAKSRILSEQLQRNSEFCLRLLKTRLDNPLILMLRLVHPAAIYTCSALLGSNISRHRLYDPAHQFRTGIILKFNHPPFFLSGYTAFLFLCLKIDKRYFRKLYPELFMKPSIAQKKTRSQ